MSSSGHEAIKADHHHDHHHEADGHRQNQGLGAEEGYQGESIAPVLTSHGHTLQTYQPAFPLDKIHRRLALPIPLGAYAIGSTTWLLGLLLLKAHHTTLPSAWLLNGLPLGFFATILAGIGEIFTGNAFGCALFLSVGAIILALVQVFLPWSSVGAAFGAANKGNLLLTEQELNVVTGMFSLIAWAILFLLLIASQRTAIAFMTSLTTINIFAITFGIGSMQGKPELITVSFSFISLACLTSLLIPST